MGRYTSLFANFTSGELSPRLAGRADLKYYYSGCKEITNCLVWPHGGITKRPGTYYIATTADPTTASRLIPFQYGTTQAYIIELSDLTMRFYMEGGQIVDGANPYEIVSPYAAGDLSKIRFTQSADVMYMVHPDYPVYKLTRSGHTNWSITAVDFENGPFLDKNETAITITPSATTGTITLTASVGIFDADHVGSLWKLEGDAKVTVSGGAENTYTPAIEMDAGESIIIQINGAWDAVVTLQRSLDDGVSWLDYNSYTGNASNNLIEYQDSVFYRCGIKTGDWVSGAAEIELIKMDEWGYAKITAFTSSTVVTGTVERDMVNTDATVDWYEGTWSAFNGYPETVTLFEQRLLFGGNFYRPQTVWGSKVDDYEDFNEGTGLDDESYTFTLVSNDVNSIRWMVGADALRIGTVGGEWRFGLREAATTPTNVNVRRFSTSGSAQLDAALINSSVIFVQYGGKKLRAMIYDLAQESYIAPEITIKSEHMLKDAGGVVDMAYVAHPDPTIWMATVNGTIVGCTYDQYNKVSAFHEHETDGYFESVASIPGTDRDELWAVVRRNIDGVDTRYVEQFQTYEWSDQIDAIYMDSTITYAGLESTTISGLEHLEGEEVVVITDGSTHESQTVTSGIIELNWTTDKVHIGKGYTSTVKLMPLYPPIEAGTSVGKQKNVFKMAVNFYKTTYCRIGSEGGKMDIIPFRSSADEMDQALPLFTGTREQAFPAGFKQDLVIQIDSDLPRPLTILGLAPVTGSSPA